MIILQNYDTLRVLNNQPPLIFYGRNLATFIAAKCKSCQILSLSWFLL